MPKSIQSKIEALLEVAQTSRGTARAAIGNQLGEILADQPAALDRGEFEIAADIVRQLIKETHPANWCWHSPTTRSRSRARC
jgi:hypothetical protein